MAGKMFSHVPETIDTFPTTTEYQRPEYRPSPRVYLSRLAITQALLIRSTISPIIPPTSVIPLKLCCVSIYLIAAAGSVDATTRPMVLALDRRTPDRSRSGSPRHWRGEDTCFFAICLSVCLSISVDLRVVAIDR